MARWAAVLVVLGATGCLDAASDRAHLAVRFREPIRVVVVGGDTLGGIAERYDNVTADDLIAWNNLESDRIEPGEMLFVWNIEHERLPVAVAYTDARQGDAGTKRRQIGQRGSKAPAPRGTTGASNSQAPPAGTNVGDDPIEDPDPDRPQSVRGAGIFGADVGDGTNDGLADAVAGLQDGRNSRGETDRVRGASMRSGTAESSADLDVRVKDLSTGPQVPSTPVRTPRLARPAAKRCRSQKARSTGEDGMYGGDGLSTAAIKSSLKRTLGTTRRCMPPGTKGRFKVIVELKVGCDGRVKNVYTINNGGVPASVTKCIETVLGYTGFPAHDIPDGQSFQYPINYNF